ncbi:MAG: hypothetical protein KGH63_02615 [Candidatus Micrarchaeota archaeon]|nr:hypothetical protein [Candidatus Micrarchaeota archaeon]
MDERDRLILLALAFVALSVPIWYAIPFVDENVFIYIGQHMSLSQMPYRDFSDNKGPVVYFFYAALNAVFGLDSLGWRLAMLGVLLLGGWAFYGILRTKAGPDGALLGTGLFWLLMLCGPDGPNGLGLVAFRATETIGLALLLASLRLLMVRPAEGREKAGGRLAEPARSWASGLLFSLALLTNVLCWPAIVAWGWLHWRKEIALNRHFLAAAALPLAAFALVLLATGSWMPYWVWSIAYNFNHGLDYATPSGGLGEMMFYLVFNLKHDVLLALVLLPWLWKPLRLYRALTLAFALLSLAPEIRVFYQGLSIDHYEIMTVPAYALGFVAAYAGSRGFDRKVVLGLLVGGALALAAYFTYWNVAYASLYGPWQQMQSRVAAEPALRGNPHVWVPEIDMGEVYLFSNSTYPGRYFFTFPIFNQIPWIKQDLTDEFLRLDGQGQIQDIVITAPLWQQKTAPACWSESRYVPKPVMDAILDHYDCRPMGYADPAGQNLTLCQRRPLGVGGNAS